MSDSIENAVSEDLSAELPCSVFPQPAIITAVKHMSATAFLITVIFFLTISICTSNSVSFNCAVPHTRAEKIDFVLSRNLALWDVVKECTIEGSKDTSIRDIVVADIEKIIKVSNIKYILLNGNKSAEIFYKNYPKLKDIAIMLPSTSPANVRLDKNIWINKIRELI